MGPDLEFYRAEHEYRREQLMGVRRTDAVRRMNRLRAVLLARRAERAARETLVRVA
jgi:hypothetical protein